MSEYINKDALLYDIRIAKMLAFGILEIKLVEDIIEQQPTADVVEVVRCKDCVYWEQATDNSGNCNRAFEITAYGGDYCSYGERREDEQVH